MSFIEELEKNVVSDGEYGSSQKDLMDAANIDGYDVPQTLSGVKANIKGVLNFRNENKDLNPNCFELASLALCLNNALATEMAKETPDIEACDNMRASFGVLYDNVINHALVGKKFADKESNIYKLFEKMRTALQQPEVIGEEEKRYLQTLCGVNFFQRERLKAGEIVQPNEYEQGVIENIDHESLPKDLQDICVKMEQDISSPEIMRDSLEI